MSQIIQVSGKRYRILVDAVNKIWNEISFINLAKDTIADDGLSLEDKVGAIKGLVTEEQSDSGYVLDASVAALAPHVLSATLRPGDNPVVTFTEPFITDTAKIEVYTNAFDFGPDEIVVSGQTLSITFPDPETLVLIKVEVSEFHA